MADAAKWVRAAAKGRFTRSVNRVDEAIENNEMIDEINILFQDVSECRNRTIDKHEEYIQQDNAVVGDDHWIDEIENTYVEVRRKVNKTAKADTEAKVLDQVLATFEHSKKNYASAIKRLETAFSNQCSKALLDVERLNLRTSVKELNPRCIEVNQIEEGKADVICNEESFIV